MLDEIKQFSIGEKIKVRTLPGRDSSIIARLEDGRVVLFDQKSKYFDKLAPGQTVEGTVIVISESYIIVNPISEPVTEMRVYVAEPEVDSILEELEELAEKQKGNAAIIPKALLHSIRLQQLIIRILRGEE